MNGFYPAIPNSDTRKTIQLFGKDRGCYTAHRTVYGTIGFSDSWKAAFVYRENGSGSTDRTAHRVIYSIIRLGSAGEKTFVCCENFIHPASRRGSSTSSQAIPRRWTILVEGNEIIH